MTLVVSAAVIEEDGRFLVTRRSAGVHLEGYWEFPGGKAEPGETPAACLVRELREELGVDGSIGEEILTTHHAYADRDVELHFLRCTLNGTPLALLGQEMQWVSRDALEQLTFPPADVELIRILVRSGQD